MLNAAAILLGGILGLVLARQPAVGTQMMIKAALGVFTLFAGIRISWMALDGTFGRMLGQIGIVLLALILGNLTGKLLRLQIRLNALGRFAKERIARVSEGGKPERNDGFITCTALFCGGPIAILGAVHDGMGGHPETLIIKGVMDGLATMAFVPMFGWGVMLSIIPLLAYQGTLTLGAYWLAGSPLLADQALVQSINGTGGVLLFSVALIILDAKKVALADYLPSLLFAPLLTWMMM
jgi:uncharacterized membrane protein YqgA involved in biofilm formation